MAGKRAKEDVSFEVEGGKWALITASCSELYSRLTPTFESSLQKAQLGHVKLKFWPNQLNRRAVFIAFHF